MPHGLDAPAVLKGNSLDVILTNPPFGGEEEWGIPCGFPADRQTAEPALLFLQLIMRRLRRAPKPGRAAVVVPNGTLFGDGVCGRIKLDLLTQFRSHTVVRLPNGVFAPYTSIPTNILSFDRAGPAADVWFFEVPPPAGRKQYTKTAPVPFEAFAPCLDWWKDRAEGDHAWKMPAGELIADGCNLDRKNPRAKTDAAHLPPEQSVENILAKEARIAEIVGEIKALLAGPP